MVLLIFFGAMPFCAVLLAVWIGLVIALNQDPGHTVWAGAVLNFMLVAIMAVPGLVLMHRAQYRWFWRLDRARATGRLKTGNKMPAYGSEPTRKPEMSRHAQWRWTPSIP